MNDIYVGQLFSDAYLEHHGILGMKWGVRRFQNKDGSLTSAGKKRKIANEHAAETKKKGLSDGQKRALKIAGGVAVGALAAYGGYKAYSAYKNHSDPSMIEKLAKKKMNKEVSKAAWDLHHTRESHGHQKIAEKSKNGQIDSEKWKAKDDEALNKFHEARDKAKQKYENTVAKAKMKDAVKNRHRLSEEELDKAISRVKKELELKRVTEENLSSGRSEVDSIIRSSGKKVAGTVLTGSMLYGIKYGLTGKFDAKDAANYVTPRPKQK